MLVLSRKLGEKIFIGENICITVVDIDRGKIRLGIEAPRDVPIFRQELLTVGFDLLGLFVHLLANLGLVLGERFAHLRLVQLRGSAQTVVNAFAHQIEVHIDPARLEKEKLLLELVQVAAVAAAWAESLL